MKNTLQKLYTHPQYGKVIQWGKLISITGSSQVLIQAIGFFSGILIIRMLPTSEYALYTLANTMLGTMTLLTDGGINTGVLAQGGKVWQDRVKLGIVMNTGMDLRKKFAIASLVVAIPALFYLLIHHNASLLMSGLIVCSLIPAFFTAVSGSLLEIAPRLRQDIVPLQKNQILSNFFRLIMLSGTIFIFPFTYIALLSAGLPQMWTNWRLRKISQSYADLSQPADPIIKKEILVLVKRILPGSIYYCIYGQISIWLISFFGTTEAIAQIGALSRLAMILNLFNILFTVLIIPRFARLSENSNKIFGHFYKIQLGLIVLSSIIVMLVVFFPSQILSVLGKNYSDLNTEIILITISSCLSLTVGITNSISLSRGWVISPIISIGISIITQVILLYILDLSKTTNVLLYSIINYLVAYIMLLVYFSSKKISSNRSNLL